MHAAANGGPECWQHDVRLMSLAVVVARTTCLQESAACPFSSLTPLQQIKPSSSFNLQPLRLSASIVRVSVSATACALPAD